MEDIFKNLTCMCEHGPIVSVKGNGAGEKHKKGMNRVIGRSGFRGAMLFGLTPHGSPVALVCRFSAGMKRAVAMSWRRVMEAAL